MSLQFISDNNGQTTGVFIPIKEWNKLKNKYKELESEELTIPDWHLEEIENRLNEFKKDKISVLDFNQSMDELEKEL